MLKSISVGSYKINAFLLRSSVGLRCISRRNRIFWSKTAGFREPHNVHFVDTAKNLLQVFPCPEIHLYIRSNKMSRVAWPSAASTATSYTTLQPELLKCISRSISIHSLLRRLSTILRDKPWKLMSCSSVESNQILPIIWVFAYNADKHDFLDKFKAILYVMGDLQWKNNMDTQAATLTSKTFKFITALAAAFRLKIWQADAIAAFVNSHIDETVYFQCPGGFENNSNVLLLQRTLYGLQRATRLWQKELSATLTALKSTKISEDHAYLLERDWLLCPTLTT